MPYIARPTTWTTFLTSFCRFYSNSLSNGKKITILLCLNKFLMFPCVVHELNASEKYFDRHCSIELTLIFENIDFANEAKQFTVALLHAGRNSFSHLASLNLHILIT